MFTPMPIPSVRTATIVNPGDFRRRRKAWLMSRSMVGSYELQVAGSFGCSRLFSSLKLAAAILSTRLLDQFVSRVTRVLYRLKMRLDQERRPRSKARRDRFR